MFIETEPTPNPASLKFLPDQPVLEKGTRHFANAEEAEASPLAAAIFKLPEVMGVLLAPGFLSVTLKSGDWSDLKADVLSIIMDHYTSGQPILLDTKAPEVEETGEDSEVVQQIRDILDEKVRPAVAQDGGDIIFQRYQDGIVFLTMQGACQGCPSSVHTLKNGIENLLKYYIPEIQEVRQAD
jgi:Fe-S cluster biogenesis protein NfuA